VLLFNHMRCRITVVRDVENAALDSNLNKEKFLFSHFGHLDVSIA
jgi:hypothetical protein